ncbi:DUF2252 domain-containing protein [Nocardia sp. NBC_00508]|uniref:DUF2252 domain-containing protein n=1 Tax=Nocardia sp. NBC_00508 TaxID=2975992 RepID=UPI002E8160EE|nr:DUF2252 domain-containing protein [Nocardia sp. NBC_00508]WUD67229.1 DUF2252 domain-containing protein [Nocardia sp. NBC_00508]
MIERSNLSVAGPGEHADAAGRWTRADRAEYGKAVRRRTPFGVMAEYGPTPDRDPVGLLETQSATRIPELVPVRYGRMAAAPFAFYRGAAAVMAEDLSHAPTTGLITQLCGDAHLSNFGLFATPERKLAFDLNDFDETYPGPFEWDVKRLVASLAVAGRDNDHSGKQCRRCTRACAAEYRETMVYQAGRGELAVWYSGIDAVAQLDEVREVLDSSTRKRIQKAIDKSWGRDSVQALSKLTTVVDGRPRILSMPPLIVPIEEIFTGAEAEQLNRVLIERLAHYRDTLQPNHRALFDRFEYVQAARKVVGVGSVGTRAWIVLLRGPGNDPLFLQVKEAQPSVLAEHIDGPSFPNQGERVVAGQRLMQAASDIFLGWQQSAGEDGVVRDFYVRQLRDGKGSAVVQTMSPELMTRYGRLCARVLAHAHARAGDRFAIAGYLGSDDDFDEAMSAFAENYTDQNARDHAALRRAIDDGTVTAQLGV